MAGDGLFEPSVVDQCRRWVGPAYRAPTGFNPGGTAGDVIRYEQFQLGNGLGVSEDIIRLFDSLPASELVWVTRTRKAAERFHRGGPPVEEVALSSNARIIATDPDGGFLVLRGVAKSPPRFKRLDSAGTRVEEAVNQHRQGIYWPTVINHGGDDGWP